MDETLENLWICPLCSVEHIEPVILCHRCGCRLLLLNKIKLTAQLLQQLGYEELSQRFYSEKGTND